MSEPPATDPAGTYPHPAARPEPAPDPELVELPPSFEAFLTLHGQEYFEYAESFLGAELAQDVVDDVFSHLVVRWPAIMKRRNPAAFCWSALRHIVEWECEQQDEKVFLIQRAAFRTALHPMAVELLDDLTDRSPLLEDGLTLGRAIRDLPGQKLDAMVMKFLLEMPDERIALVMGIQEVTVRSLISQARTRIQAQLEPRRIFKNDKEDDQ
ncbi:RNA polymerase sigma factor [Kitasatospora phosalacinea]|uniref:RNA polymerase sigma factor n=1 Tax=Kitasatospora phosalacinea TaxID=2065 RepID=UPI003667D46B